MPCAGSLGYAGSYVCTATSPPNGYFSPWVTYAPGNASYALTATQSFAFEASGSDGLMLTFTTEITEAMLKLGVATDVPPKDAADLSKVRFV